MGSRFSCVAALFVAAAIGCGDKGASERLALGEIYSQATAAIESGDYARAVELLDQAVEKMPNDEWTYRSRALANAHLGEDEAATADVEKCLSLNPENPDAKWIQGELEKKVDQRFKGRFANPPSALK